MNYNHNYGNTAVSPLTYNFNDPNSRTGAPQPRTSNMTHTSNRTRTTQNGALRGVPNQRPSQLTFHGANQNTNQHVQGNVTPVPYNNGAHNPHQKFLSPGGNRINRPSNQVLHTPNRGNQQPIVNNREITPQTPISGNRSNYNPLMGNMGGNKPPSTKPFSSPQHFKPPPPQQKPESVSSRRNQRNPLNMKFQSVRDGGFSPTPSTSRKSLLAEDFEDNNDTVSHYSQKNFDFGKATNNDWKRHIKKTKKQTNVIVMKTKPLYEPTNPKKQYNFKGILRPKGAKSQMKKNLTFNNDVEVYNVESFKMYNVDMGKRSRKSGGSGGGKDECTLI